MITCYYIIYYRSRPESIHFGGAPTGTAQGLAECLDALEASIPPDDPRRQHIEIPIFRLLASRLGKQHPDGFIPIAYLTATNLLAYDCEVAAQENEPLEGLSPEVSGSLIAGDGGTVLKFSLDVAYAAIGAEFANQVAAIQLEAAQRPKDIY